MFFSLLLPYTPSNAGLKYLYVSNGYSKKQLHHTKVLQTFSNTNSEPNIPINHNHTEILIIILINWEKQSNDTAANI